jgi:GNAT superfamily N-acetyltransferase
MIELSDIPKSKISCIRNLWEKLNKMHYEDSIYFEDHFAGSTFEKRIQSISKNEDENLKITIVKDGPSYLGYCISSIQESNGEIESIYLEDDLCGRGIGKDLIDSHVKWMKERKCNCIRVAVSFGHDSVIDFYHHMGFFERLTYFELKE